MSKWNRLVSWFTRDGAGNPFLVITLFYALLLVVSFIALAIESARQ